MLTLGLSYSMHGPHKNKSKPTDSWGMWGYIVGKKQTWNLENWQKLPFKQYPDLPRKVNYSKLFIYIYMYIYICVYIYYISKCCWIYSHKWHLKDHMPLMRPVRFHETSFPSPGFQEEYFCGGYSTSWLEQHAPGKFTNFEGTIYNGK